MVVFYWKIISDGRIDLAKYFDSLTSCVLYAFIVGHPSVICLFGSRMLLNLREVCDQKAMGDSGLRGNMISTVSALRFADPRLPSRMYMQSHITMVLYLTYFY